MKLRTFACLCFGFSFLIFFTRLNSLYALGEDSSSVSVELVSNVESIQPGQPFWVGLYFKLEPGWHIYWKNPGYTGFPPSIDWKLPTGFQASDIHWPIPIKMTFEGFVSFGYEGEVLLPIQITPPEDLDLSQPIVLTGNASWLMCSDSCVPGKKNLELSLPVENSPPKLNSKWNPTIELALDQIPKKSTLWQITPYVSKEIYGLLIESPDNKDAHLPQSLQFFSLHDGINPNLPQKLEKTETGYFLTLPLEDLVPEHLEGVLINQEGWNPEGQKALAIDVTGHKDETIHFKTHAISLTKAMAFAFIGGIILNLMPCVFPILGLKVLSFMKHAGDGIWKARIHGIVFAIGVLASFLALAAVLLILRAGGEFIGWGFQLQSPYFIAFLCFLLILIALNFLGVFEIGTSLIALGSGSANHSGYLGTFSSGILATVLATPCTAPFMGTALGFALTQPPYYSLCIFAAVGLGMSMPYLILSFSPALIKYLPRPGSWMETFKQAMAFPLIATVLWLLWVFGKQTELDALIKLLFGLLLASIAAWIYGRFATFNASTHRRHVAWGISSLFLFSAIALSYTSAKIDNLNLKTSSHANLAWENYSAENLQKLRAEGKAIYIDFTAAWCLTCQANKKNVFSSPQVLETLKKKDVILLHADWTKNDPTITRALQSYGRSGVPTNVIYPAEANSAPILLPELLTPAIVLNALEKI